MGKAWKNLEKHARCFGKIVSRCMDAEVNSAEGLERITEQSRESV